MCKPPVQKLVFDQFIYHIWHYEIILKNTEWIMLIHLVPYFIIISLFQAWEGQTEP